PSVERWDDLTTFVGRHDELRRLAEMFSRGLRLVTIVGLGGLGKTRLARRYAATVRGALVCDLGEARSAGGGVAAVGQVLDVPLAAGEDEERITTQLGQALATRAPDLVVLDELEHVVRHASSILRAWLAQTALRFLVTSRARLGLKAEAVVELG